MHGSYIHADLKIICTMTFTFEFKAKGDILSSMTGYVGELVKIIFQQPIVYEVSCFKCICTMTWIFEIKGEGHG